jgi:hypothetical protein
MALEVQAEVVTGGVVVLWGGVVLWQSGTGDPASAEAAAVWASVSSSHGCGGVEACALTQVEPAVGAERWLAIRRPWWRCAWDAGAGVDCATAGAGDGRVEATLAATVAATVAVAAPSVDIDRTALAARLWLCS